VVVEDLIPLIGQVVLVVVLILHLVMELMVRVILPHLLHLKEILEDKEMVQVLVVVVEQEQLVELALRLQVQWLVVWEYK
tara:strand:- start:83 stop:322 length:240 start_codon:yes stop_codon:yes gene_type:complete